MKGAIIVNGYFSNEATENQTARLVEEFNKRGVTIDILKGNEILTTIGENTDNLYPYDFIIYLNKDIYQARKLEKMGYKLFNSADAIAVCDDKMLTHLSLSGHNIKMPFTISSPIMYSENTDDNFLQKVQEKIPYPIIVKNVYGSMGRSVFIANNYSELKALFEKLKMYPHIYQQKVGTLGMDTRVITIGKRAVSAMCRYNPNDFRSNVELGGTGTPVLLDDAKKTLAEEVSKVLNLDYAGIDILTDETGEYICEVNSNAFFLGMEKSTGVNIAGLYAEHIIKTVKG
ncbi:MAG: RimK family alpha-L-glutamate ligase [Clostridia bacterium]|nr:RimK family alpha-L-glutamate ligase [Clostridia bacterium]